MKLMLLSNSTGPTGFLEYALPLIESFAGDRSATFIPFASVLQDWDTYNGRVSEALRLINIRVEPLHRSNDPVAAIRASELIIVGGGNSFHLLYHCRRLNLLAPIAEAVSQGTPFIGWSAGSNIVSPSIRTTNDMPIIEPGGLDALGLVAYQINPHYLDSQPPDFHGETRRRRIEEFTALWETPVLGLPEGSWVEVSGARQRLGGDDVAWWFTADQEPVPLKPGACLPEMRTGKSICR